MRIASRVDKGTLEDLPVAEVWKHASTWLAVSRLVSKVNEELRALFPKPGSDEASPTGELSKVLAGSLASVSSFLRSGNVRDSSQTVGKAVFQSTLSVVAKQAAKQGKRIERLLGYEDDRGDAKLPRLSPKRVKGNLRKVLGNELKKPEVSDAIRDFTNENAKLLRDFATEEIRKLGILTRRAIREGWTTERYAKSIKDLTGVRTRRAFSIARDQVMRFNSDMTTYLAESTGATEFVWIHSGQSSPPAREEHVARHGRVHSFTGDHELPGEFSNCQCLIEPIWE